MNTARPVAHIPLVLFGVPFHNVTYREAVEWSVARMQSRQPGYIATVNMDFVMQAWRDPELQRILLEADLIVADGDPLVRLSRLFGPGLKERVAGSDLTPMLAEACRDHGLRLFNLGAGPGVAERAAAELQRRYPGLGIAGTYSPPPADVLRMDHEDILRCLRAASPDLLLVAFGAPKQEKWINMHMREWAVPLAVGVGGTLDFLVGAQIRAPRWVQRVGMEWFWRMASNPRRLFGRYAGNVRFLLVALARLIPLRLGWGSGESSGAEPPSADELADMEAALVRFRPLPNEAAAREFIADDETDAGQRSRVVDMRGVAWLSSLELGALVLLARVCRERSRRLFLWAPSARVSQLLRTCRLDQYLDVEDQAGRLIETLRTLKRKNCAGLATLDESRCLNLRLPAEVTAANLPDVRCAVDEMWARSAGRGGPREIIIDATGVGFVDSAALGFLVGLKQRANRIPAPMHCVGFHAAALRAIKLARLETVLNVEACEQPHTVRVPHGPAVGDWC